MPSPSKNRHGGAIALATLLFASSVAASPPRLEAASDVDACPSAGALRRSIATHLGRDDFDAAGSPDVVVRVRRAPSEGGALAADVTIAPRSGASSARTLTGDTCSDLVRAAALTIALAIEQEQQGRARSPERPFQEPENTAPTPKDTAASAPLRTLRDDRFVATASALTSVGLLPRPSAGAGLSARVRVSDAIWISGRGLFLPGAAMPNDAFSLRFLAGGGGVCAEPFATRSVAAVGCAHVIAGSYEVTEASTLMRAPNAALYLAGTLSAGLRARVVGPLSLSGDIEGHFPFTRPTFLTDACPPVGFEPPFAALALWLGAGVSIP